MRYRITIETDYANISSLLAIAQPGDVIRVEPLEDEKAVAPPKPRNNKKAAAPTNRQKRYGPQKNWDAKQDARLLKLKAEGQSVAKIAATMKRTVASVQSRYTKLHKEMA